MGAVEAVVSTQFSVISTQLAVLGSQFCFRASLVMQIGLAALFCYGVGRPNHLVSAAVRSDWVCSPAQATYPSGRIKSAVGAVTGPRTGSSHVPSYFASSN